MDRLVQDLRIAVRSLLRRRTFTVVAVLTLATGIGATTGIFSLVDAVLLRPLPYREPSRLFRVWQAFPDWQTIEVLKARWDHAGISYPQYAAIRGSKAIVENAAIFQMVPSTISGKGGAERINFAFASATVLATLGLRPLVGRDLSPDDEAGPGEGVAMIGYDLWRRRFAADPSVVGQTITVDQRPYVVVGVMPPELRLLSTTQSAGTEYVNPDVWVPVGRASNRATGNFGHGYQAIARLKPGVDVRSAESVIVPLLGRVMATYRRVKEQRPGGSLEPLGRYETRTSRPALWMLLAGAGIVLLVACGNVANLMLSEIAPRTRELALRATLGAGRARLVRMLLTESVTVALVGGLLGLGVASWCVDALVAITPPGTPNIETVRLDYRVFLFSLVLTVGTGLLFGLLPAWLAARADVMAGLKEGRPTAGRTGGHVQGVVCAAQVALAAAVVVTAALLVQSLVRLSNVDPGFSTAGLLTFNVDLPRDRYQAGAGRRAAFDELRRRLVAVPGVSEVTLTSSLPFRPPPITSNPISVVDGPGSGNKLEAERRFVLPNFFNVLGVRLIAGEWLREPPAAGGCRVLVSQTTVRRLWPDGGAVGSRVDAWGKEPCTVAGVVTDTKERSLAADPLPTFYMIENGDSGRAAFLVKSDVAPQSLLPAVRQAVAAVDPELAVLDPAPMDAVIDRSLAANRYRAIPLALFALATLLLSAVGTYGVMAQIVTRQTRALGIRLALGATPGEVMALVLRHAAAIAVTGLALGIVAALGAARLFRAFLFGVTTTDAATYAGVALALSAVLLVASWIPARRATRLDPAAVLRAE